MKAAVMLLGLITALDAVHWQRLDKGAPMKRTKSLDDKPSVFEESQTMLDDIRKQKNESRADQDGNQFKEVERTENKKQGDSIVHAEQKFKGARVLGARVSDLEVKPGCKRLYSKETLKPVRTVCLEENREEFGTVLEGIDEDIPKDLDPTKLSPNEAIEKLKNESSGNVTTSNGETIVYVDKNGEVPKAKVGYIVTVFDNNEKNPRMPMRIVDAETGKTIDEWDNLQTIRKVMAAGEGPGGNNKTGTYFFGDGLAKYGITYLGNHTCEMETSKVKTVNLNNTDSLNATNSFKFSCFDQESDAINGAASPMNDAMFFGLQIYQMYQKWFDEPPMRADDGKPIQLLMKTHYGKNFQNAYWNGEFMTFGDGGQKMYPLVCLDITSHEIAHGITARTSALQYKGESGGLNEAFADMAGKAAERFVRGKEGVKWSVGGDITKGVEPLRYMDHPEKSPSGKAIADVCDMKTYTDPHYSSGIFNRVFYLMSTKLKYDVWDAYELFYIANTRFWSEETTFTEAAELLLKAASEMKEGRHTKWDLSHIELGDIVDSLADVHIMCHLVDDDQYDCDTESCPAPTTRDYTNWFASMFGPPKLPSLSFGK